MFEGYTIIQLLNLRSLCADTIEQANDVKKRAEYAAASGIHR